MEHQTLPPTALIADAESSLSKFMDTLHVHNAKLSSHVVVKIDLKMRWKWHPEGGELLIESFDPIIVPREMCRALGLAFTAYGVEEGIA